MKKILLFTISLIVILAILLGVYEITVDRRPLKDRMIEKEKQWLSYHHSSEDRDVIKTFIQKLEKMSRIDPPYVLKHVRFSVLKNNEGEYMYWTLNWVEDGFVTKGFRLRHDPQLSSTIIKEIPFPENMWNRGDEKELKTWFNRGFCFVILPQSDSKWIDSLKYGTLFPSGFFDNPIYITLYDSQGRECEPILCEKIKEVIGKHHTVELTEPNVKLWTGN
jgi:hypothetical protein